MASTADLAGLGMPVQQATILGYTPTTVVAAGTTAAAATIVGPDVGFIVCDTGTSLTGIKLNASTPIGRPIFVTNPDSDTAIIYPPTNGQINGGTATTGGQNVAQNKVAIYIRQTTTLWVSIING